jgi:capsular polysaccharide biosynthesis protein
VLTVLKRRGLVFIVTIAVVTACAYLVASIRGTTYTAEGVAVVSASQRFLTPDQANQLAITYAVLIPKDAAVAQTVARELRTTVSAVQSRMSVFNSLQTALLAIDYRGTSASNAVAGTSAILRAISGGTPASPNITAGSIREVFLPSRATSSSGTTVLVAIGVILGIALGALFVLIWERVDPRVDSLEALSQEVGAPTSPLSAISQDGAAALLARWEELAGNRPIKTALVPVTADVEMALPRMAHKLARARQTEPAVAARTSGESWNLPGSEGNGDSSVVACAVPSADLAAQKQIMSCDLAVLVARTGTSRAALRVALEGLWEFGMAPRWAILMSQLELETR